MPLIRSLLVLLMAHSVGQAQVQDGMVKLPEGRPLGALVRTSTQVVQIEVKQGEESASIQFRTVEALKGKFTGTLKIDLTGLGEHYPAIAAWTRPKQQAVLFLEDKLMALCLGGFWVQLIQIDRAEWRATGPLPHFGQTFAGRPEKLVQHVRELKAGREAVVTIEADGSLDAFLEHPTRRDWVRGQKGPLLRVRTGPKDEAVPRGQIVLDREGRLREPAPVAGNGNDPADAPVLLLALASKDSITRAGAAVDLGLIGPEARASLPALRRALADGDQFVRLAAVQAIGRIDPRSALPLEAFRTALKAESVELRRAAATILGSLGPRGLDALPALLERVNDKDEQVRIDVALALRQLGRSSTPTAEQRKEIVEAVVRQLKREPEHSIARLWLFRVLLSQGADIWPAIPHLRHAMRSQQDALYLGIPALAADALGRLDPPPIPVLIEALEDLPSASTVSAVIQALSFQGSRARLALPALARRLDRESETISKLMVWDAIFEIDPATAKKLVPVLRELAKRPDPVNQMLVLYSIEKRLPTMEGVEDVVQAGLTAKDSQARITAAAILIGAGKSKDAMPVLLASLADKDLKVREQALTSLTTLGPKAQAALPALRKLVTGKDNPLTRQARRALWHVEGKALTAQEKAFDAIERFRHSLAPLLEMNFIELGLLLPYFHLGDVQPRNLDAALGSFSKLLLTDPDALGRLEEGLRSGLPDVRLAAALGLIGANESPEAIKALVRALEQRPVLFDYVSETLLALGVKARPAAAFLRLQLLAEMPASAHMAKQILQKIDPSAVRSVWDVGSRRPERSTLTAREAVRLWDELADIDLARGHVALCKLIVGGERAVALLADKLRPIEKVEPKRLAQLLSNLQGRRFTERERAFAELEKLGPQAEAELRQALAGNPELELRRRLDHLLARLDPISSPERLRELRAVEALENIGSAVAVEVLKNVASGVGGTRSCLVNRNSICSKGDKGLALRHQEQPHDDHFSHLPFVRRPVGTDQGLSAVQRAQGRPAEGPPFDDRRHPLGPLRRRPLAQPAQGVRPLAVRLRPLPQLVSHRPVGQNLATLAGTQDEQRRD